MIIYHPLTDVFHAMNRCMIILKYIENSNYKLKGKVMNIERYRIYDYYLLFPNDTRNTSLPSGYRSYKKLKYQNKFNIINNQKTVFKRLKSIQDICINNLISYNIIDSKEFKEKQVLQLISNTSKITFTKTPIDDLVLALFSEYFDKINVKELKERTKLTEHRYEQS
ncbi:hypothetical protein QWY81_10315 [Polaribacter undariae]|uniref:Uncharacterized protein n=1 Tax=Polaribacter sejongensis TaxID=985043 RepID=A0AAJ1QXY0_9FLAO|nr:ABC-three component system middle component 5 [Polaribacter undariae]MDN3619847.1 hypothetical protein [Polaribacter undariae]UWD31609.1 hypothetical protein NQP51_15925 [Polaribacter undariae]